MVFVRKRKIGKSAYYYLVKSIRVGRDKWKKRAQDAHYENKLKRNRIEFLEKSKEKLKQENIALRQRVSELESTVMLDNNSLV